MSCALPGCVPLAPRLGDALWVYVRIGLLSFGGPAGQIALMQDELVERRGWIGTQAFDRGLSFSMMLPGPEAQQLATWLGWKLHGLRGGLAAGLAFILPGAALMVLLAWLAAARGEQPLVAALFAGVQPFVIALVLAAMVKIARRALVGPPHWALAVAAFAGLAVFGLPFPLIIAVAALAGLAIPAAGAEGQVSALPGFRGHGLRMLGAAAALGLAVFALVRATYGDAPFTGIAELFTTAAFVSFGGAYALLPYVAERAVEDFGWLTAAEMLNGLAIAEATPGPLILVNTYAGFFAGWSAGGGAGLGALTAALATFYTFLPSFMLILAFAPVVERVQSIGWARRALAGISAAVVGVIANLAFYLGGAAFWPEGAADAHWPKLALFALALWLVFQQGAGMVALVLTGLGAGVILWLTGLAP